MDAVSYTRLQGEYDYWKKFKAPQEPTDRPPAFNPEYLDTEAPASNRPLASNPEVEDDEMHRDADNTEFIAHQQAAALDAYKKNLNYRREHGQVAPSILGRIMKIGASGIGTVGGLFVQTVKAPLLLTKKIGSVVAYVTSGSPLAILKSALVGAVLLPFSPTLSTVVTTGLIGGVAYNHFKNRFNRI